MVNEHLPENDSLDLHAILHDPWLRVHNIRFADAAPDSFYNGIITAERVIHEVAAEQGIDYHALRAQTRVAPPSEPHGIECWCTGCTLRDVRGARAIPPETGNAATD